MGARRYPFRMGQPKRSALARAIEIAGSQTKLARVLGVSQQTVSYWASQKDGEVPAEHCSAIEEATGRQVKRRELRPDLFGRS